MSISALEYRLLSRLKLRQLQLLVMVDKKRNILRAAQHLNMAQPAASKNIRDLEITLEMKLFTRSSKGVTPTLHGEVIIRHAKLILSQIKHASEELTSIEQGITGHINIGTLLAASPQLLPEALLLLKKERPKYMQQSIEGTNDKLMPGLRTGEIDLIVGRLPKYREREGLKQHVLYSEPISIVVRKKHPLSKAKSVTLKILKNLEWILPTPQTSLRRQIEAEFRENGFEPPINIIESMSVMTNYAILTETDMVAAMPYQVAKSF